MSRFLYPAVAAVALAAAFAFQTTPPAGPADRITDPFALGWMLADTNGDGIADFVNGKIVVPDHPTASQNTAAANVAARIAYGATGLTPPLVIPAAADTSEGPRIFIGKAVAGVTLENEKARSSPSTAISAFSPMTMPASKPLPTPIPARAPYQWRVSGDKLAAIADTVRAAAPDAGVELAGLTYLRGKADLHRAFLRSRSPIPAEALSKALADPHLAAVHELIAIGGASAVNSKPEPNAPANAPQAAPAAEAANGAAPPAPSPARPRNSLHFARAFHRRRGRIPVPAALNGHLFVPAGAQESPWLTSPPVSAWKPQA